MNHLNSKNINMIAYWNDFTYQLKEMQIHYIIVLIFFVTNTQHLKLLKKQFGLDIIAGIV